MTNEQQAELDHLRRAWDDVSFDVLHGGALMVRYRVYGALRRKMIFSDGTAYPVTSESAANPRCPHCAGKGYCYPAGIKTTCVCVPR